MFWNKIFENHLRNFKVFFGKCNLGVLDSKICFRFTTNWQKELKELKFIEFKFSNWKIGFLVYDFCYFLFLFSKLSTSNKKKTSSLKWKIIVFECHPNKDFEWQTITKDCKWKDILNNYVSITFENLIKMKCRNFVHISNIPFSHFIDNFNPFISIHQLRKIKIEEMPSKT